MKRRSSLGTNPQAIDRTIANSDFDKVVEVANNVSNINLVVQALIDGDVDTLVANISAISNANDAYELINNLNVNAIQVNSYTPAAATLDGSDLTFSIPRGLPGADGQNGLTPELDISFNEITGVLDIEVVGYLSNSDTALVSEV